MSSLPPSLGEVVEILRKADLLIEVHGPEDVSLQGVSQDSRGVRPGDLFLAWKGVDADAHDHVAAAARAGAAAAVVERFVQGVAIPQVEVTDGRLAGALAADFMYGSPWKELFTCGITGTNGKTTTALLVRHLLEARGKAAAIGTLGIVGADGEVQTGTEGLTTPGPVALSGWLRKLVDDEVRSVAMEASSHALEQRRIDGMRFDVAVFTNFGVDHLDYHAGPEAYLQSKKRLLGLLSQSGAAAVNADDPAWREIPDDMARASAFPRFVTFGIEAEADIRAVDVELLRSGARFRLEHGGEAVEVRLPLLGRFNVENALAAAAVGVVAGLSLSEVAAGLERAPQIPGRLEIVTREPFSVVIDFAHTAEALERVLAAVRPLALSRLIVVFGAGGDRDRTKRPEMGRVAEAGADLAIVTSDNPRSEDPDSIVDDIVRGMSSGGFERVVDRKEAIGRALELAKEGDFILLAGKGHERFQTIGGRKVPFDERTVVRELLGIAA